jgi:hypothetical protein
MQIIRNPARHAICKPLQGALLSDKVKPLSPHHRFLIALHSPYGVVETGLLGCPPEKNAAKLTCSVQQRTFSGPVLG